MRVPPSPSTSPERPYRAATAELRLWQPYISPSSSSPASAAGYRMLPSVIVFVVLLRLSHISPVVREASLPLSICPSVPHAQHVPGGHRRLIRALQAVCPVPTVAWPAAVCLANVVCCSVSCGVPQPADPEPRAPTCSVCNCAKREKEGLCEAVHASQRRIWSARRFRWDTTEPTAARQRTPRRHHGGRTAHIALKAGSCLHCLTSRAIRG